MATYVEMLAENRERVEKTLRELIEQQEHRIVEINEELAGYIQVLDQWILRTTVFRNTYGAGQQDTLIAETATEEASKPVTEATRQREKETQILDSFRRALEQLQEGMPLEDLGKLPVTAS
jgi:hypothetical protein